MTIISPSVYNKKALEQQSVVCLSKEEALTQNIRALRIGILNIMPYAEKYEFSLLHPLGKSILQIEPIWIRLHSHQYASSNAKHLDELYVFFEDIKHKQLDALIVTGAPVEKYSFQDVVYWKEIEEILLYAQKHYISTLGICWGGMALAKILGIEKQNYRYKLFGVYPISRLVKKHPIVGGLSDVFMCPQSRYAGYSDSVLENLEKEGKITLLGYTENVGYTLFETPEHKFIIYLGHPEYDIDRIIMEHERDKDAPLIKAPANFKLADPKNEWRSSRNVFFSDWLHYVYWETSFVNEM